jgi:hypothetical protein
MDTLELKPAKREGGGGKTEQDFYDFMINGRSMREIINIGDQIGIFGKGSQWKEHNKSAVDLFLLKSKSELVSGRVPLYVCGECGDILEGSVTVKITADEMSFIWSDFGYESEYGDGVFEEHNIGPYHFDKTEYYNLLSQFI